MFGLARGDGTARAFGLGRARCVGDRPVGAAQPAWCSASAAASSSGIGAARPSALVQLVPAGTSALRPDTSSVRTRPRATATRLPEPVASTANSVPTTVVTAPGDRTRSVPPA